MKGVAGNMEINGKTRITGLFGYPVEHTLSPAMHNAAFSALGLNYCYVPFLVHPDSLTNAVQGVRAMNLAGVNVTVPHKENVIPFLDEVSEEASFIGAVNTIVHDKGRLTGYNTDGRGFMQSLAEKGVSVEGKAVIVIGAGGASRAISYYLCKKAKSLSLFDIDKQKAGRLVSDLKQIKDAVSVTEDLSGVDGFDIVVQATPLGMKDADPLPVDAEKLRKEQIVYDLIYKKTRLLRKAEERGCVTLNGLGMLLWQGVFAFELWTGQKPDVEIMRSILINSVR
jgi:shikimate dehydrogenase